MAHRFLIADDNEELRLALVGLLEHSGYTVVQATTGKEALAEIKSSSRQIDLLITDLHMPDMDGLQLLTEVKRFDPQLPVLAISGSFSGRLLQFASTFGVPTLEKPFTVPALLKAIESALPSKASSAS